MDSFASWGWLNRQSFKPKPAKKQEGLKIQPILLDGQNQSHKNNCPEYECRCLAGIKQIPIACIPGCDV
jgi:hypothetical protein